MSAGRFGRRSFIKATVMLGAGAYVLAFADGGAAATHDDTALALNYLRIAADGTVTVISPVAEIGQGTSTALPMVVAEALDADWQRVRFELAPVAPQFNSPILRAQLTGASTGVSGFHDLYRDAGATARTMLMAAAARQWKVAASECATDTGKVVHEKSGRSLGYGELASRAAAEPVPVEISKAPRKGKALVRTAVQRLDIPAKVNGTAQFAIDVRLPDMLYATVVASPTFGGTLVRDARAEVLKQKGIKGVLDLPDAVAIVADRWWTARRARDTLYGFPHQDGRWVRSETPVPTGMWRSVGASQTVFTIESFVGELASKTGTDPYRFRRALLATDRRALAFLDRVASISGWGKPLPAGRAIGLGISHKHLDCLVGQSAEVSVENGQVVVHRICTVADPCKVINPDTGYAQMEGAAIWGLSAALFGKISISEGRVQESNVYDYRVLQLSESPVFTTEIIESGVPFEGMGEGGASGIAPAICNAIFRLTGKRIPPCRLPASWQLRKVPHEPGANEYSELRRHHDRHRPVRQWCACTAVMSRHCRA
ncbi:MAG TPA: molybdopterin cofactor-binding domain-containing protein [Pseudoduganella sp.]